jgi:hypothetical protein
MTIDAAIAKLRSFESEHTQVGLEFLQADNNAIYPLDILMAAALKRSMCLLDAFCDLIEKRNFVAAAPLIRLQLDSVLRLHAASSVPDPHQFSTDVLAGKHIRNMKDRHGKRMTDQYLLDRISHKHPRIAKAYSHLSGYIHLSDKHIFNVLKLEGGDGKFSMHIGPTDTYISDDIYLEAIIAFHGITQILFGYFRGWAVTKAAKARKA